MPSTTRRDFVRGAAATGLAATGSAAAPAVRPAWGQGGKPSDRVNMAVVGFRGRGRAHYQTFAKIPNVRVTHLADVDERLFPAAVDELEKISGHRPATEVDMRKLLERDDIDAISVATPDHWHALHTIWGCQAEKDVYVEKPCSYTLLEGRRMVQAARKYKRIVQVGLNRRSDPRTRSAMRYLHGNPLGPIYRAKAVIYRGRHGIGRVQESSIPRGVNWDMFLGPAPYRAFTLNRFHYGWHFFKDTSTNEIGNNGVHYLDLIRLGMRNKVHPVKIHCFGGFFVEDDTDQEVPNMQNASFEYADGAIVEVEATTLYSPPFGGIHMGAFWYAPKGYVSTANNFSTVLGEYAPRTTPDPPSGISLRATNLSFPRISYNDGPIIADLDEEEVTHFQNFINCVRSRKREDLRCEIEEGHRSTSLCHLANIAFKAGRKLTFDPATETFPGDEEANGYLTRTYREPYVLPDEV